MTEKISLYKVFVASTNNLAKERAQFREIIRKYNEEEGIYNGVQFFPVYWEKISGGIGRPQELINIDLDKCDFMVLILWDTWGSASGNALYSSACEEEFERAVANVDSGKMKDILVLFKDIDNKRMKDPGKELQKVLDFRNRLISEMTIMFKPYKNLTELSNVLRPQLRAWIRNHHSVSTNRSAAHERWQFSPFHNKHIEHIPFPGEVINNNIIDRLNAIKEQCDIGDCKVSVESIETMYTGLISESKDITAMNDYAKFLYRIGNLSAAEKWYKVIIDTSIADNNIGWVSRSYANLAIIAKSRGDLDESQRLLVTSLDYNTRLKHKAGMADNLRHLAKVKTLKGQLDSALHDANNALTIFTEIEYKPGLADTYSDLGIIYRIWCRFEMSMSNYEKALALNKELDRKSCQADNYLRMGTLHRLAGELDIAERYFHQALSINETLCRKHGIARDLGHLGLVYLDKDDFEKAKEYLIDAQGISEEINDKECSAKNYCSLSKLFLSINDIDQAKIYLEKASKLNTDMSMKEGIAVVSLLTGWLFFITRNNHDAQVHTRIALQHFADLKNHIGEAECRELIAVLQNNNGYSDDAEEQCNTAIKLCRNSGAKLTEASVRMTLSSIYENYNIKKALKQLEAAENTYKAAGILTKVETISKIITRLVSMTKPAENGNEESK